MCSGLLKIVPRVEMPSTWKGFELRICKMFGGERSGPLGKDCPDCIDTEPFDVECKYGAAAPINSTLQENMAQCVRNSRGGLPTLVMKCKGWSDDDAWVCFRLKDFEEYFL